MLMPVAHASTAMSGEKTGFFAALCTANGVVLVYPDQTDTNDTPQSPQANSNNVCPLCLLIEQGLYDSTALQTTAVLLPIFNNSHNTPFSQRHTNDLNRKQLPIRAPPAFS